MVHWSVAAQGEKVADDFGAQPGGEPARVRVACRPGALPNPAWSRRVQSSGRSQADSRTTSAVRRMTWR
jgi:hypothetical protein